MTLLLGDCLETMKTLADNSVDAVVTDPPYGLAFMGKKWDYDVPSREVWAQVYRVMKPGAHLLSFGGTRTYHRMVVAIEDAGFEIRDQVMWIYGSGFPKSLDVSKAIDKAAGAEREVVDTIPDRWTGKGNSLNFSTDRPQSEIKVLGSPATDDAKQWQGFGTALKPANEPIVLARKPLSKGLTVAENVLKYGTGAINVDASRIVGEKRHPGNYVADSTNSYSNFGHHDRSQFDATQGRWPANVLFDEWDEPVLTLQDSIPEAAKAVIEEYYAGYCKVSDLREKISHLSESKESQEVLQSGVLLQGTEQANAGQEAFHVGAPAYTRDNGQDCQDKEEAAAPVFGQKQLEISGLVSDSRVQDDLQARIAGARAEEVQVNVSDDEQNVLRGAPIGDGSQAGPSTKGRRSGASQKRQEAGQSNQQSRTSLDKSTQGRTLEGVKGDKKASLLIRESDVLPVWARYFKDTGFTVRAGAARVLDEQTKDTRAGKPAMGGTCPAVRSCVPGLDQSGRKERKQTERYETGDVSGASRFFYVAKASKRERNAGLEGMPELESKHAYGDGLNSATKLDPKLHTEESVAARKGNQNNHPTVKPIKLMQYLVKLITPPGGVVLDPFMGSGSTGCAARSLGFDFIGCEMAPEYMEIAKRRIEHWEKEIEQFELEEGA